MSVAARGMSSKWKRCFRPGYGGVDLRRNHVAAAASSRSWSPSPQEEWRSALQEHFAKIVARPLVHYVIVEAGGPSAEEGSRLLSQKAALQDELGVVTRERDELLEANRTLLADLSRMGGGVRVCRAGEHGCLRVALRVRGGNRGFAGGWPGRAVEAESAEDGPAGSSLRWCGVLASLASGRGGWRWRGIPRWAA